MIPARFIVVAVIAAVIVAVIGWQAMSIKSLRSEVAVLSASNQILKASNDAFAVAAKKQNEEVRALNRAVEAREAAARLALVRAEKKAAEALSMAAAIQNRPMAFPDNECKSLEVILNEAIEGRQK